MLRMPRQAAELLLLPRRPPLPSPPGHLLQVLFPLLPWPALLPRRPSLTFPPLPALASSVVLLLMMSRLLQERPSPSARRLPLVVPSPLRCPLVLSPSPACSAPSQTIWLPLLLLLSSGLLGILAWISSMLFTEALKTRVFLYPLFSPRLSHLPLRSIPLSTVSTLMRVPYLFPISILPWLSPSMVVLSPPLSSMPMRGLLRNLQRTGRSLLARPDPTLSPLMSTRLARSPSPTWACLELTNSMLFFPLDRVVSLPLQAPERSSSLMRRLCLD
mmetsp:Transcript_15846/g.31928  ORF Transcript_15846/g.31928 Transcript_15846/m.31928 type:complete len:273 (-) Transcript_15846:372-1190(-)